MVVVLGLALRFLADLIYSHNAGPEILEVEAESALAVLDLLDGLVELAVLVDHKPIVLEHDRRGSADGQEVGLSEPIGPHCAILIEFDLQQLQFLLFLSSVKLFLKVLLLRDLDDLHWTAACLLLLRLDEGLLLFVLRDGWLQLGL